MLICVAGVGEPFFHRLLFFKWTTEQLGKKSGKDQDAGKMTYPGVLGLDAANKRVDDLLAEALAALEPLGAPAEPLRQLARYMAVRTK